MIIPDYFAAVGWKAYEDRIKALYGLLGHLYEISKEMEKKRRCYQKIITFWQDVSRFITCVCVVISALIGNGHTVVEAGSVATFGVILVISNAINGTVGEIINKENKKILEINDTIGVIMTAKIKVLKSLDMAKTTGKIEAGEYHNMIDLFVEPLRKLNKYGIDATIKP